MARRQVLEVKCDRCGKTETQEAPPNADETKHESELLVSFHSQQIVYDDLCLRCRSACENYFKSITKQNDEKDATSAPEPKKSGLLGLGGKRAG